MPHVSNSYTHGTTKCTVHQDRNTFLNVNKNDNYRYDRTLVGNWVEERHEFPQDAPISGTTREDAPRLSSTQAVYGSYNSDDTQQRLMADRAVAAQTKQEGNLGAAGRILADNSRQIWTGTSSRDLTTPPSDMRLFGSAGRQQRANVSAYTLGASMGLQPRTMRSWNRHNLNYECQAEIGNPSAPAPRTTGAQQFNPYLTSNKASYTM